MLDNLKIRELNKTDELLFEDFLYQAVFQKERNLLPKSVIYEPRVYAFIKDWGQTDDYGVVAIIDNKIVGMAWSRIITGELKGYGNIDEKTPELAMSVLDEYQKRGIGYLLLEELLKKLKAKGYQKMSLSVDKDNYAVKLYQKVGFRIIVENEHDYLMVCDLN
jgi:ribosomal protein S18 acetylase RimI-like enzyme